MLWGWFDPVYFVFLAPGILLAVWAQWRVKSAYVQASQIKRHGQECPSAVVDQVPAGKKAARVPATN